MLNFNETDSKFILEILNSNNEKLQEFLGDLEKESVNYDLETFEKLKEEKMKEFISNLLSDTIQSVEDNFMSDEEKLAKSVFEIGDDEKNTLLINIKSELGLDETKNQTEQDKQVILDNYVSLLKDLNRKSSSIFHTNKELKTVIGYVENEEDSSMWVAKKEQLENILKKLENEYVHDYKYVKVMFDLLVELSFFESESEIINKTPNPLREVSFVLKDK